MLSPCGNRKREIAITNQTTILNIILDKPVGGGVPTAITKHIIEEKCKCALKDFKIIGNEPDYHKRLIKESLFIKLHRLFYNCSDFTYVSYVNYASSC